MTSAVIVRFVLALAVTAATARAACAQSPDADAKWPDRALRFIVPLPAGAAADVVARLIGQRLSERLGQPVLVEDRPGASGMIATEAVAKAAPDGYTLGLATSTTHITAPIFNTKLPYDPVRDFAPVAIVGLSPYVLVVHPGVPANNVAELIALAKTRPRQISYSSVGQASQGHLAAELFASMAGIALNHIPYKSSTHAVIDLNEGRIDMQFGILGTTLALIREGKLRALATTAERRTSELPDVPSMIESGLPGYEATLLFAVVLPAGAPPAIVARLNREISEIMAADDVKRALAAQAIQAVSSTPDELRERIRQEIELWRGLAVKAGIRAE
jgi:tripartite-type tricarboxylate transporter receptor subunit TctC